VAGPSTTDRKLSLSLTSGARLKDYAAVIMRRWMLILLSLLSVVLSTVFILSRIEDVFESYSTLVIEESNPLISEAIKKAPRSLIFLKCFV
jgi:uncharacterized protein involved in exopolysaccharide biosynthesis